jgi:hypothetical protein
MKKIIKNFIEWYNEPDTIFAPNHKMIFWGIWIILIAVIVKILQKTDIIGIYYF